MKKLLTILCLVLLVSCSNEVDPDKLVYRNGLYYEVNSTKPFTGSVVEYHDNGQLEHRENYKKGLRDGLFEEYHDNGQLKERGDNKNGRRDGLFESFYENSYLEEKGNYKNGYKEGLWEEYSGWDQTIIYTGVYKDGEKEGLHKRFHYVGNQLEYEINYINGKTEGLVETYDKEGGLISRENFKNGLLEGLKEEYWGDGQLSERTNYKKGKKDGLEENFNTNGCLNWKHNYKEDLYHGWSELYVDCSISHKSNYRNGELHGLFIDYLWRTNKIKGVSCYKNGEGGWGRLPEFLSDDDDKEFVLDTYLESILDGTYCETYNKRKEDGPYKTFYDNGKLRIKGNFKNGEPDGLWERLNENGQLKYRRTYKKGVLTSKQNFKNGKKDGYYERFNETDGSYLSRTCYKNNVVVDVYDCIF
jgi:antitoxin component YwqK of YwqJK toxin-antitoxin module